LLQIVLQRVAGKVSADSMLQFGCTW
jgi:hypothetical protein